MFIGNGKLEYGWKKKVEALTPAAYANLRSALRGSFGLPENQAGMAEVNEWQHGGACFVDDRTIAALTDVGIEVTLTNYRGLAGQSPSDVHTTVYQIAVPDIGVMQVRNVEYLYDADEYTINAALDRGWKILAVCPPTYRDKDNENNRPTFVMGHTADPKARA